MTTDLKALEAGLINAVKPSYDIHVTCPSCEKEVTTNNGEWLLWCGDKEHAEAILEAARKYLSIQRAVEAKEWALVPTELTRPMLLAAEKAYKEAPMGSGHALAFEAGYYAMTQAAPEFTGE